jgi:hypothetical protein
VVSQVRKIRTWGTRRSRRRFVVSHPFRTERGMDGAPAEDGAPGKSLWMNALGCWQRGEDRWTRLVRFAWYPRSENPDLGHPRIGAERGPCERATRRSSGLDHCATALILFAK